jgi:hypothetical protein
VCMQRKALGVELELADKGLRAAGGTRCWQMTRWVGVEQVALRRCDACWAHGTLSVD